ncbi:MAG: VCBS domain-containing protein [Endozoicomonas sp.]
MLDADNNSLKAYLNDVEFGSANGSAMATHGDEASFGRLSIRSNDTYGTTQFHDGNSGQQDYGFTGKIDEAYIYGMALTPNEISALDNPLEQLVDTFDYEVSDSTDTRTATLYINVNRTPEALTGSLAATEDGGAVSGQLSAIEHDSNDTLTYNQETGPARGTLSINATTGAYTYDPGLEFQYLAQGDTEDVTFSYRVTDAQGDYSTATITINVTGVNDAPTLATALTAQSVNEAQTFSYQIPANTFTDIDNVTLSYIATLSDGSPLPSWLSFDQNSRTFAGTPDNNDVTTLSIKVTARDPEGLSADATFNLVVNNVNDLPVTVFQESGGLLSIEAEHFHSNIGRSGNAWAEESQTSASGGKAVGTTDNNQAFNGSVVVGSSPELIYEVNFATTGTYYVWIRGRGADGSGDTVHLGLDGQYLATSHSISGFTHLESPNWTNETYHSPAATINVVDAGRHQINLWVREDGFKADKIVLTTDSTYTPSGAGPAESGYIGAEAQTATEETSFSYTLPSEAFFDLDGDTLTLSASLQNGDPLPAWLSFNAANQTFEGIPDDPDLGTITIKVTAEDGFGSTDLDFTLNVAPVNDAPLPVDDTDSGNATVAGSQVVGTSSALSNDSDVESDPLTITGVNGKTVATVGNTTINGNFGDLTIDASGNWIYTPASPDINANLVGLWHFNSDSLDSAPGDTISDHGTLQGAASTDSTGLNGNGLTLTANGDALLIPSSTEINSGAVADRTISLAFRVDQDNDLTSRQVLFEEGDTTRGLNAYIENTTLYMGGYDSSIGWDGTWYSISVPSGNDWHNVSLVLGNNTLSAWLDREQLTTVVQDSSTGNKSLSASHASLVFGGLHGDTVFHDTVQDSANNDQITHSFIGQLDEARVYNRALTNQEVNALHYQFETTSLADRFIYTVSDGTDSATATLTIDVNRAPQALNGTLSASEDGNSVHGQLSTIDLDSGETLSYELVTDTSEGSTTVNSDGTYSYNPGSGFQDLAAGATRDVSFVYRVTDSQGDSSTASVTITVTGTNDAPILQPQTLSVNENSADNTPVDTVSATDQDPDTTLTYSLTDSAEGRFAINSSTGEITVADGSLLDHESNNSHSITVQVSDGDLTDELSYNVSVNDANEAPVLAAQTLSVNENSADNTPVGIASATDQDAGTTLSYSLTDNAGGRFAINSSTGEIIVADGSLLDHESNNSHSITVRVSDGSLTDERSYTVSINDANDAPVLAAQTLSVNENSSDNTPVGSVSATDQDAGTTLTYSLTDNADGRFAINSSTGEITVADGSLLDYESSSSHSIIVQVSDGDLTHERSYNVSVNDANEAPVLAAQTLSVSENSADNTPVGTVSATDQDADTTLTYSLTDNADGRFAINSSTGEITVADGSLLDYESNNSHSITVQASDGDLTHERNYAINITNVNEAPTASDNTLLVNEDTVLPLALAHFGFSDVDGDSLDKIQITSLAVQGSLQLNGTSVSVNDEISRADIAAGNLNYQPNAHESGSDYASLGFKVHDGTTYSEDANTLTFNITAVADTPVLLTSNHQTDIVDTEIYTSSLGTSGNGFDGWGGTTVSLFDQGIIFEDMSRSFDTSIANETGYTLTFGHIGQAGHHLSVIWAGEVIATFNTDDSAYQFETLSLPAPPDDTTELRIMASYYITTADITLTQHTPSTPYYSFDEDQSVAINLSAQLVDTDSSESLSVMVNGLPSGSVLTDGGSNHATSDGSAVDISGWDYNNLSVTPPLNRNGEINLTFVATATESANAAQASTSQEVILKINPVNDPAVIDGDDTGSVTEDNSDSATGTLTISDVDSDSEAMFVAETIAGTYGALNISAAGVWSYSVNNNLAVVQAIAGGASQTDTLTVRSIDGTTQDITITVSGSNDAPVMAAQTLSIDENSSNGTSVGTVSASDVDAGTTLTYSLTDNAGGRFAINSSTGEVTVADGSLLNHENADSHSITVQVTDGGLTHERSYTVSINDINDTPVSADRLITINEDSSRTLTAADFAFTDEDNDETLAIVKVVSLPAAGTLALSGTAVTPGQEITIADINSSLLVYTPALHASGDMYAYFDFKVSGGSLFSTVSNRVTFNVTPVADTPTLTVDGDVVITTMNFDDGLASGWTSENTLQIAASGGQFGDSYSGTSILELDYSASMTRDALFYTVDTSQGHNHEISLWVKERTGADGTDSIEVVWNGDVIQTIDPGTNWGEVTVTLPNLGIATTSLAIQEVATQNQGTGPLIDEISITRLGADNSTNPLYDYELSAHEDNWIPLDINAALTDTDGSEALTISLAGVPNKFILTDGANRVTSTGATIDISGWTNDNLTIIPFRDEVIDFTLTVTATSTETANSLASAVTKKIRVDMQDLPDLTLTRDGNTAVEAALPENFIYAVEKRNLLEVNIETGYSRIVTTTLQNIEDLALRSDGVLYALNTQGVHSINPITGSSTLLYSNIPPLLYRESIAISPDGILYGLTNTKRIWGNNTITGENLLNLPMIGYEGSGALTYYNGKLYLTEHSTDPNGNDSLIEIDINNNFSVSVVGDVGYADVNGLSVSGDNKLYGISGNNVLEINTTTGAGTVQTQLSNITPVLGSTSIEDARKPVTGNLLTNDPNNDDFLVVSGISAGDNTGLFYGIENSTSGTLVTINPHSGATTNIGNTGTNMLELAQDSNGNLYGVNSTNLYLIDTASGDTTEIGAHSLSDIKGLAFDSNGVLYALKSDGGLYTLNNTTGASTSLGQIGVIGADNSPTDLTFHNGNLYTVGQNTAATANILIQIDLGNNLAVTAVGTDMGILGVQGLAIGRGDELYAITTNKLYKVDASSGSATLAHTLSGLTNILGLASVLGTASILQDDTAVAASGTQIEGQYGTLEIQSDGSYSYLLDQNNNQVNNLDDGDILHDIFTYSGLNKQQHHGQETLSITITGSTDNPVTVTGTSDADTILGHSGNDNLAGAAGDDTITADAGNDMITGGSGDDILTGDSGSDHFIWNAGDAGTADDPALDTITDFQVGSGGDVLDLRDLLADEEDNPLDQHLHFNFVGSDTIVEVKPETDGSVTQKITLENTDLSLLGSTDSEIITNLLNNGNLQVDQ